jgi:hypothetical protein
MPYGENGLDALARGNTAQIRFTSQIITVLFVNCRRPTTEIAAVSSLLVKNWRTDAANIEDNRRIIKAPSR